MNLRTSRLLRWTVPAAAVAAVAGGAQLTAWAASNPGGLPTRTARDVLVLAQQAHVQALSGTVRSTTKLGLPALPSQGPVDWSSLVAGTQTLRVFADGPTRQRVDLLGTLMQASVVHNGRDAWTWNSETRQVTHLRLPADSVQREAKQPGPSDVPLTPQQAADRALAAITPTTSVTVGRSAKVAGRPAYELRLVPNQPESLVGSVHVYVDAATGMALRTVVTPRGSTDPAVDVGFTSLRLSAPAASTFRFSPPRGSTVRQVTVPSQPAMRHPVQGQRSAAPDGVRTVGTGWTTVLVADHVPTDLSSLGASAGAGGDRAGGPGAAALLLRSARPVHGAFGDGRLLRTRLVTVLLTNDGHVYAGSVTPATLERVAAQAATAR